MAYQRINFKDQNVERPRTYEVNNNADGSITLVDSFGLVEEIGTPINADTMNHLEDGIAAAGVRKYSSTESFNEGEWVVGEGKLFVSLIENNIGNALTDESFWEELSFGGGLEIGDIGIAPLGIDESKGKRRYLNGQLIMQEQYVSFTNKLKSAIALYPSLATTESNWQATVTISALGQCGKFVVDDEQGTIRLPKIIMPIQGLTSLSNLAEIVEAGLPSIDHTHTRGTMNITGSLTLAINEYERSGAFTASNAGGSQSANGDDSASTKFTFNASKSWTGETSTNSDVSDIYGNSNTVQQEQIQYPYFIQVATGAETEDNIINEIELNNPFSFGDSKYSPKPLNNLSWLKSEGQWNSKAVYPAYYDWALTNFNNGVEGFALSTGEYTDYDVVINPAEETFRLPLLDGSESFPNHSNSNTFDDGVEYVAECNGFIFARRATSADNISSYASIVINNVEYQFQYFNATNGRQESSIFIPVTKGDVYTAQNTAVGTLYERLFIPAQGNGSLYFYVGETVQNANLINAGRALEILPNKLDKEQLYNKMTNCILEEPQNIKLELTNGVLTLKAGSKITWGGEEYKTTVVADDKTYTYTGSTTNAKCVVCVARESGGIQTLTNITTWSSGSSAPTETTTGTRYFNYTNKIFYLKKDDGWEEWTIGYPIATVTLTNGIIASIDQIFNGFGYIGSYVWKDKGVKALSPNGFNNNGTFANIEWQTERLNGRQLSGSGTFVLLTDKIGSFDYVPISTYEITSNPSSTCRRYYNPIDNFIYNNESGNKQIGYVYAGTCTITDGKITSFDVKKPVRLVDNNVYITETYRNGTSWYRIWSDGWCEQGGQATSTTQAIQITFLVPYKDTKYTALAVSTVGGTAANYNPNIGTLTTNSFYFNSMINKASGCHWQTCGYIR